MKTLWIKDHLSTKAQDVMDAVFIQTNQTILSK